MKKFGLLFAILLALSLVAAACSSGGNEATQVPGVTEGAGGLYETPMATEPSGLATSAVETPMATATQALTTEMPTVEATQAGGGITSTQVVSGTAQLPGTGQIDPYRLSNMMDFEVIDNSGNEVGKANDMVLNLRNTKVEYVLVDFGGFLGIGERTVAVPWNKLTLQTAADANTGAEGKNAFVLDADKSMIENAPEFKKDLIPGIGQPAENWDASFKDYWSGAGVTGTITSTQTTGSAATTEVAPSSTVTTTMGTTTTTGTQPGAAQDNRLGQFILASDLLGRDLAASSDTQGQLTVKDAVIDPKNGDIQYFIVTLSGMDTEEAWIAVPPKLLITHEGNDLRFADVNPQALVGAPHFTETTFPNTTVKNWDNQIKSWWNSHTDLTTP